MGSLRATVFSSLLLKRFFDSPFRFDLLPNLVAMLATAVIASGSGWLASFRILGQKPLEILRGEYTPAGRRPQRKSSASIRMRI